MLAAGLKRLPATAPIILDLRLRLANGHYLLGEWTQSLPELKSILADAEEKNAAELMGKAELYCGKLLIDLSQTSAAQAQLRGAISHLTRALGNQHALVSEARAEMGRSLADAGRYAEADAELKIAQELGTRWAPPDTWTVVRPKYFTALMQLQQDEPAKAELILADIVAYDDALSAAYFQRNRGLPLEMDSSAPVRAALGGAYARQGKLVEANAALRRALELGELAQGARHPAVISTRLALAEVLLAQHSDAEAQSLLQSITSADLAALPAVHPIWAQWNRVTGLLALRHKQTADAERPLRAAYDIYQTLYGPRHWRTIRASNELLLISQKMS